jgi:hypothetical protein
MSSLNSGQFNTNSAGIWEYVDIYSSVRILVSGGACSITLDWANEERGNVTDNTDIMVSETLAITETQTITRSVIARQLRVSLNNPAANNIYLSVFYLDSHNIIKIIDDHGTVVDISQGSLNIALSSAGGQGLRSTSTATGGAFYTVLTDKSGGRLKQNGGSLSVALRDNTGENLSLVDTGDGSPALVVHMSDACGFSVATTKDVQRAHKAGTASFLALPVGSYITDYSLNMSVTLRDLSGEVMAPTGKERLAMKLMEDDVSLASTFDVSGAINNYNVNTVINRPLILYCVNLYNDSATTSWVTIFDQSLNNFHPNNTASSMRIAVPAKQTRDIYFPRGVRLDYGLSLIGSALPNSYDIPFADNKLFMSGVYSPFTEPLATYVSPIAAPDQNLPADNWPGIPLATRNQSMKLTYVIPQGGAKVELAVKYIVSKLYIAWGDGTVNTYTPQSSHIQQHTYAEGTYEIFIVGEFYQYGNTLHLAGINLLKSVDSFGTLAAIENLDNAFNGATSLTTVTGTLPPTVKSINYMFAGATNNFTGPRTWDVQNVSLAIGLFLGCTNYNEDISDWNWAALTDGSEMLRGATKFDQPIGKWRMPRLNNIENILNGATVFNQSLAAWQFGTGASSYVTAIGSFTGTALSDDNYSLSLVGWRTYFEGLKNGVPPRHVAMFGVTTSAKAVGPAAIAARTYLRDVLNWRFDDTTP